MSFSPQVVCKANRTCPGAVLAQSFATPRPGLERCSVFVQAMYFPCVCSVLFMIPLRILHLHPHLSSSYLPARPVISQSSTHITPPPRRVSEFEPKPKKKKRNLRPPSSISAVSLNPENLKVLCSDALPSHLPCLPIPFWPPKICSKTGPSQCSPPGHPSSDGTKSL